MTSRDEVVVVDASVWVSALLPQDLNYLVSRRWLDRWVAARHRLRTPVLALPEVAGVIARRTGDPARGYRAKDRLRRVPGLHLVPLDDPLSDSAATLAASLRLRGADAVYVALARRLNAPLVTWDQEQLPRAAAVIQTRTP